MEEENRALREQLKRAIEVFTPQAPDESRESIQQALSAARAQFMAIVDDTPELEFEAIQTRARVNALERKREKWVEYDGALLFLREMAEAPKDDIRSRVNTYMANIKNLSISTKYLFNHAVIQSEPNRELHYDGEKILKDWTRAIRRHLSAAGSAVGPFPNAAELSIEVPILENNAPRTLQIWTIFLQTLSDAVQYASQFGDAASREAAVRERVDDYFAKAEQRHGKTLEEMLRYVLRESNLDVNVNESISRLKKAFRVHVLAMGSVMTPFPSPAVLAFFVSVGDADLIRRREVLNDFLTRLNGPAASAAAEPAAEPGVVDLITPPASPQPPRKRHQQQQPQLTLDERVVAMEAHLDSIVAEKQGLELAIIDMDEGDDKNTAMANKDSLTSQYRTLLQQLRALRQQKIAEERKNEVDDLKAQLRIIAADKEALDRAMRDLVDDAEVDAASSRYDDLEEQSKRLMTQLARLQRRDNPMPPPNKKMASRIK